MRKIYSILLAAVSLLFSANLSAVDVTTLAELQGAIDNTPVSLLMVAATISAMAAVPVWTAKANLKITSTTTNEECDLILRQSDEFTGATNAYQVEMMMEGRNVAMYAWVNSQEYGTYGLKNLEGLVIGLKAQADAYTITADKVDGTAMYLEDTETGTKYPIVNGKVADITFAAAVDNTNRFKLTFVAPESADPTICHYYNKLEVRNSNGMTVQIRNSIGVFAANQSVFLRLHHSLEVLSYYLSTMTVSGLSRKSCNKFGANVLLLMLFVILF